MRFLLLKDLIHPYLLLLTGQTMFTNDRQCDDLTLCNCTTFETAEPAFVTDPLGNKIYTEDRSCSPILACGDNEYESFYPTKRMLSLRQGHPEAVQTSTGDNVPQPMYFSNRECRSFARACDATEYSNAESISCKLDHVTFPTSGGSAFAFLGSNLTSGFNFAGMPDAIVTAKDNWWGDTNVRVAFSYLGTDSEFGCNNDPSDFVDANGHGCDYFASALCVGASSASDKWRPELQATEACCACGGGKATPVEANAAFAVSSVPFQNYAEKNVSQTDYRAYLNNLATNLTTNVYKDVLVTAFAKPDDPMSDADYPRSYISNSEWGASGCCTGVAAPVNPNIDCSLSSTSHDCRNTILCSDGTMPSRSMASGLNEYGVAIAVGDTCADGTTPTSCAYASGMRSTTAGASNPCLVGPDDFAIRPSDSAPGYHKTTAVYSPPSSDWCMAQRVDTCTFKVYVYDDEAPVLTCPSNIELCTDGGATSDSMYATIYTNVENRSDSAPFVYSSSGTSTGIGDFEITQGPLASPFFPVITDNVDGVAVASGYGETITECAANPSADCLSTIAVDNTVSFAPRTRTGTVVAYNDKVTSCTELTEVPTLTNSTNDQTGVMGLCTVPGNLATAAPAAASICGAATGGSAGCIATDVFLNTPVTIGGNTIPAATYKACVWVVPDSIPGTCAAGKLGLSSTYVVDTTSSGYASSGAVLENYLTLVGGDAAAKPDVACVPKCPGHTVGVNPGAASSMGKFIIGDHMVKWTATDSFGNAASCQTKITVHDCACPKFEMNSTVSMANNGGDDYSCTDRTTNTVAGQCFAVIDNLSVEATDNSGVAPKISMYVEQQVGGSTVRRPVDSDYKFPLGATTIKAMAWDKSAWFESTAYPSGAYPGAVGGADNYPRILDMQNGPQRCSIADVDSATTCSYFPIEGTVDSPCRCEFTVTVTDNEAPTACTAGTLSDMTVAALDDDAVSGFSGKFAAFGSSSLSMPTGFGNTDWMNVTDNSGCVDPATTKYYVTDMLGCAAGGGEVVSGHVQENFATAAGTAAATRFYVGEVVEITAVFSDCSGNTANCSFSVIVPGQWMKMTTFDAAPLTCPSCASGCGSAEAGTFGQTCLNKADLLEQGVSLNGQVQLDLLPTADGVIVDTTPGSHLRVNAGAGKPGTLLGHKTFWTPSPTTAGTDGNDNLGKYIGTTEDYDCDSVGVAEGSPVPSDILGFEDNYTSAGLTYFTMEDPDGTYEVVLDEVIVPRSSTTKYVSAYYKASGSAGSIFFKMESVDTCQNTIVNTSTIDISTVPAGWQHFSFAVSDAVAITISFGLISTASDAEASFDHVGFGELGCTDAYSGNYNENAIINDGTCVRTDCCADTLATNYDATCPAIREAASACDYGDRNGVLAGMQVDMQTLKSNENELRGLLQSIQGMLA
eukprot:SAG22_NODE_1254_length_5000_cov_17.753316_1_plen_1415_part_00